MFMGEYKHNMDKKGRVIIPSSFRDDMGEDFVMTRGLDKCLFVYPREQWEILENKLTSLPLTNKSSRTFVRFFLSGATECNFDKQGRISIPSNLRDFANLNKEIVIIGLADRLELWASERWEGYIEEAEDSYENIAEQMEELGI